MKTKSISIEKHFSDLADPRQAHKTAHSLMNILIITICAAICGADNYVDVEHFGKAKEEWLKTFLDLPNGIPSHDTFGRVFSLLDPEQLEKCFQSWISSIAKVIKGVVAIDGKTLRRSFDSATGKSAIHMVSAWASDLGLVVGQLKTEEKSNEITAIPNLLKQLELKGCIVTIDAMGCQKEIAKKIRESDSDYIFALKGNQHGLQEEVYEAFQKAHDTNFDGLQWSEYHKEEKSHGRQENRHCWVILHPDGLERVKEWQDLNAIIMIESISQKAGQEEEREYRFYISSLEADAEQFAKSIRSHWGIENSLHWVLDVAFREDESRIRSGYASENFSLIRRLALNLLKRESSVKTGIKNKRLRAGWDEKYFWKVLTG
jgi:predicted transposase YbfD/YdcC